MSYDTRYHLNWEGNGDGAEEPSMEEPSMDEVLQAIAETSGDTDKDYWRAVVTGDHAAPWYDHEVHLALVSKQFPDTVFTLDGEGESGPNEDIWKKYFRNGLVQRAPAVITYPEFDESLLGEPEPE